MDRKKVRIPAKIAQEVTKKYNALRRPKDKQEFQTRVSKSYKDMLTVVNESLKEGTWTLPNTPKQKAALKKLLSKPLKAKDATDKLYALMICEARICVLSKSISLEAIRIVDKNVGKVERLLKKISIVKMLN